MGRKKIEIKKIKDKRSRTATLKKRGSGLFKKAYELATLTDTNTYVIIEDKSTGKLSAYLSRDNFIPDYTHLDRDEWHGPQDFEAESCKVPLSTARSKIENKWLTAPPLPPKILKTVLNPEAIAQFFLLVQKRKENKPPRCNEEPYCSLGIPT